MEGNLVALEALRQGGAHDIDTHTHVCGACVTVTFHKAPVHSRVELAEGAVLTMLHVASHLVERPVGRVGPCGQPSQGQLRACLVVVVGG